MVINKKSKFVTVLLILLVKYVKSDQNCNTTDSALLCHGTRVLRHIIKAIQNPNITSLDFEIVPGVEIVGAPEVVQSSSNFEGRENTIEDRSSILFRIKDFIRNHELKIKLAKFFNQTDIKNAISTVFNGFEDDNTITDGRKKDKGGVGMMMMAGLMMGKMMAALGLGGVGILAMKALGVSTMALLIAGIVGLKKLSDSGQGDGGHHVQYVTAHDSHIRKRRQLDQKLPLPYRGWSHLSVN